MSKDSDKLFAILGSVAFHLVIILMLAVSFLRANVYEYQDVEILPSSYASAGGSPAPSQGASGQQQPSANLPASPPPSAPKPRNSEPSLTQEQEKAAIIAAAKRKHEADSIRRQQELEENRRKAAETERLRKAEEERRQTAAIDNRVTGAFGRESATGSGSQGGSSGNGAGDNPFGNSGQGGGSGTGFGSFSLAGRSLEGSLPRPQFTVQEDGVIVIDITVDPRGNVIYAEIGKGTQNITNESLRQSALAAARKAKFNPVSSADNQRGSITYRYELTR